LKTQLVDLLGPVALFDLYNGVLKDANSAFLELFDSQTTLSDLMKRFAIEEDFSTPFLKLIEYKNHKAVLVLSQNDVGVLLALHDHSIINDAAVMNIEHECMKDPLTGALRKNYGERILDDLLKQFARYHQNSFSIIMLDIDHFKPVNDTHGHLAGDYILSSLSQRVQQELRSSDVFIRFGGEEFLIILPMTKASDAILLAKRILFTTKSEIFRFNALEITITVSIGITTPLYSDSGHSLIDRVDHALYKAKQAGRDRIEYL
jgi:diguanylate cyclase (GGDEF)-like protein